MQTLQTKIILVVTLILVLVVPAIGVCQLNPNAPWPMFHHDVRHTGKTDKFGTQIGKLKWTFVTGGPVTSSPAIVENGTVFIGSTDNNLYAINAEDGTLKWKFQTGGAIDRSSPAIDANGVVYIGSYDGYLYAFDTKAIEPNSPAFKWRFKTFGIDAAISSSPAIAPDGTIIFGCSDGYLYAVNPDGSLKWASLVGNIFGSSPAIDTAVSQVYIGTMLPDAFYALDLSSGAIVWVYNYLCGGVYASPVVAADSSIIFCNFTTYYGDRNCLDFMKFQIYNFSSLGGIAGEITETTPSWKLDLGEEDIYTTPAMLEDTTFFVGSGASFYRRNPDGSRYLFTSLEGERIESSPALDGKNYIFIGSIGITETGAPSEKGARFYCAHADRPAAPVVWIYPPLDEEALKGEILSSPAIGGDARHSIYFGASDGNVYALYDGIQIKGKVEIIEGVQRKPLPSVKMTLRSDVLEKEIITYTSSTGEYEFTGLENVAYTVTPEKPGYLFNPESRTITINGQDYNTANFEAYAGYSVSGTITNKFNQPMLNVQVTIDGIKGQPETTLTDGTGFYEFTGLGFDTYTVTPFSDGFGFTPPFKSVTITSTDIDKDKTNIDFVGTLGFQISGKVTDIDGIALAGVTITMQGTQNDSTLTDENGAYSFVELANGIYTITAQYNRYDFSPPSQTITIASISVYNVDFTAATGSNISGYVLEGTTPLKGVAVDLIRTGRLTDEVKQTAQTNETGFYNLIGIVDGTYMVQPRLAGYGFDPSAVSVTVRNNNITDVNFRAIQGMYISGTVTNFLNRPLKDVTLELTGSSSGTATTNSAGHYSFLGLQPGIYTVAVSTPGYLSIPASRVVDIASAGKDSVNFKMRPTCPVVLVNIPFTGGKGTIVNIFGFNFGFTEPSEDLTADFNGTSVAAGVYFGTADVSTWVKAEVLFWSPVKILVRAPAASGFGIARVWVVNDTGCIYVNPPLTNFFIYGF